MFGRLDTVSQYQTSTGLIYSLRATIAVTRKQRSLRAGLGYEVLTRLRTVARLRHAAAEVTLQLFAESTEPPLRFGLGALSVGAAAAAVPWSSHDVGIQMLLRL